VPDLLAELIDGLRPPGPEAAWPARIELPHAPTTRFAPAPTGALHLGHLVNALVVWGAARAASGRVVLRIEDHDRQRSRHESERDLLDDLDRLGLRPDEPTTDALRTGASRYRQSDEPDAYEGALAGLARDGLVYACDCTRTTFAAWEARHGTAWDGPGCPGGCRSRELGPKDVGTIPRIALPDTVERWVDVRLGRQEGRAVGLGGDPPARDRAGNWTYGFSVVVDDIRHGIDLVVRGEDILEATPQQLALARLLGRDRPATFLHHPLVRTRDGAKLSKADRSVPVRSLLDAGVARERLFGAAAWLAGLTPSADPIDLDEATGRIAALAGIASGRSARP
jgi:glutamyl/glutaminyl-tRNA synthetase